MKKAITFLLLFVILLSAVGCTDHKKDPLVEESTSVSGETEITTDSSDIPVDNDSEETNQTNASSDQPVTGTVTEKESISTTISQGKTESPDKTQPTNSTGTNPLDQTNSTTATEPSSPSDAQTTPSADPPFVTGNDGVDLPIDLFD